MTNLSENTFGDALAHHRTGRLEEAVEAYGSVLADSPDHPDVLNNLGACLIDLGRAESAVEVLSRAAEFSPADADILNNLGNALQRAHRAEEAVARFEAAAESDPGNPMIRVNLAKTLLRLGAYEEGCHQLTRARSLDPASAPIAFADTLALPVIYDSIDQVEVARMRFEEKLAELEAGTWSITDPAAEVGLSNFYLPYQGRNDRDIQERLAAAYLKACPALDYVAPHCRPGVARREGRVRIGFVSTHFSGHTIGKLFRGLITGLYRSTFDVTVFHPCPDLREIDPDLRDLSEAVDTFVPISPGLEAAQTLIASFEQDILYYPDIGMEPVSYFLAFARLAPVQCAGWGHPVTTGIPAIDHFLSWRLHEPVGAADHYSEPLTLFDGFCSAYVRPEFNGMTDRKALGIPEGGTLYLCPQSLFKVHPGDDQLWGDILRRDPNGRIVFLGGQQARWADRLKARFDRTFPDVAGRIIILPRLSGTDYLQVLQIADVILDTPRWSGGNTSFEAFAAGKVIVTLPGDHMRGLFTTGLYRQMGLEDLVPASTDAYVEMAVHLGSDLEKRSRQEARIQERSSRIFNNKDTLDTHSRFFEEALRAAGRL